MLLYNASATHNFAGITGLTRGTVAASRTELAIPWASPPTPIC